MKHIGNAELYSYLSVKEFKKDDYFFQEQMKGIESCITEQNKLFNLLYERMLPFVKMQEKDMLALFIILHEMEIKSNHLIVLFSHYLVAIIHAILQTDQLPLHSSQEIDLRKEKTKHIDFMTKHIFTPSISFQIVIHGMIVSLKGLAKNSDTAGLNVKLNTYIANKERYQIKI